jgi:uncharacterized protein
VERCDPWDVQWLDWNLHGLPQRVPQTVSGGAEAYTRLWTQRLCEAKAAGIEIGVIAVLHPASLEAGPEKFYRYFTEELGLGDFQVNTPFPGGPAKQLENDFKLDLGELARFLVGLFDIWIARGYTSGVSLGPFDGLINHFTGEPARLPCIWKENCSNQFISIDSKGTVAQCDCWVTSYPEYFFGNVFQEPDLTRMLKTSRARRDFVERPKVWLGTKTAFPAAISQSATEGARCEPIAR